MSPEKARVAVIEDDLFIQKNIAHGLTVAGHQVVLQAMTREEALAMLSQIKPKGVQAVVLGGSLGGGDLDPSSKWNDSQRILAEMKRMKLDVPTIGLSGDSRPMAGVTVDLGKDRMNELAQVITDL